MAFKRIALMGTGSLGTILGAYLTKGGVNIDLIDVNQAHVDALNKDGAHVIGTVDITVPVHAITPDQMEGEYDLFLYMTKQTYNDTAIPQMVAHLAPGGYICVFQNGIPEDAVSKVIGEEHTLGATVGWGATWVGPGVSEATTIESDWFFNVGTMNGEVTPELEELKALLENMCRTNIETKWMSARWEKLLANVAMSGMSACLGCTFGDVLDDPKSLLCAQHLARECVRVTKGLGYECAMNEQIHMTIDHVFDFHNAEEKKMGSDIAFMVVWGTAHRASKASMLQDLEKGLKCEVDAINGVLSSSGRKCGVPTPVSDKVVEIIHEIEDGKRTPCWDNLDAFDMFDGVEIRSDYKG